MNGLKDSNVIIRNEFRQLAGVFSYGKNLIYLLDAEAEEQNNKIDYELNYVKAFWVEPLPQAYIDKLDKNSKEYKDIQDGLKKDFEIEIDGTPIKIGKTQIYCLENLKPKDVMTIKIKNGYPCLFNCLYEATETYGKMILPKTAVRVNFYGQRCNKGAKEKETELGNQIFNNILSQLNNTSGPSKLEKKESDKYYYYASNNKSYNTYSCFIESFDLDIEATQGNWFDFGNDTIIEIGATNHYVVQNWIAQKFDIDEDNPGDGEYIINYKASCILEREEDEEVV